MVRIMNRRWLPLGILLIATSAAVGATKQAELPDKEMLKMMEFLREMEMIKQLEMMRELDRADSLGEQAKNGSLQKPSATKKEAPK
jgi:hypothetical protein